MRHLSLIFGIIFLSMLVMRCKTGSSGGSGGTQKANVQKPSSTATTPPLTSKADAASAVAAASQAYVEAACTDPSASTAVCNTAKALSDPNNATNINDAIQNTPSTDVNTVNQTVSEQLTPTDTTSPSTPAVQNGLPPTQQDTATATDTATAPTKQGMTNQQMLGVGLMVWGVIGAVGFGATSVHMFVQQVKAQRLVTNPGLVQPMPSKIQRTSPDLEALLKEGNLKKISDWVEHNKSTIDVKSKTVLKEYVSDCILDHASTMTVEDRDLLLSLNEAAKPDAAAIAKDANFAVTYNKSKLALEKIEARPVPPAKKLPLKDAVTKTFSTGKLGQAKAALVIGLLGGATSLLGGYVYASGGPSNGMNLEGDTTDPLATYLNTLGDIAMQVQAMSH